MYYVELASSHPQNTLSLRHQTTLPRNMALYFSRSANLQGVEIGNSLSTTSLRIQPAIEQSFMSFCIEDICLYHSVLQNETGYEDHTPWTIQNSKV